ncbi:MAG: GxxExxY protein [Azospirillaceae bacterium]|nr:GxxExxY protein [Azospirillaceae bacterium]
MRADLDPRLDELTERIIGAGYAVANELGHGFLESVYQNAFVEELAVRGMACAAEKTFKIYYRGKMVGLYKADLVVQDTVIVEIKAIDMLTKAHSSQVLNYLKASRLPVGLLFNFGRPSLEIKRILSIGVR